MKRLFIGDIHGLTGWEDLVYNAFTKFYDVVFLGDYVDSFHVKGEDQIENLEKIIELKKQYPKKVTLLLGNHDFAYIHGFASISGFQFHHSETFKRTFRENKELFDIAIGYYHHSTAKYTLVTHGGLTYKFWTRYIVSMFENENSIIRKAFDNPEHEPIHKILNSLAETETGVDLLWKVGSSRGGLGTPGPLWCDYSQDLLDDPHPDINQIVGHTPSISPRMHIQDDNFYICIDDWGNKKVASMIVDV